MIDIRAARADPDTWRAALARKGAALDIPTFPATPDKLIEAVERALRGGGGGSGA